MGKRKSKIYWFLILAFIFFVGIIIFNLFKKPTVDISLLDSKFCEKDEDCIITSIKKFDCCGWCFIEVVNKEANLERGKWERQNCDQEDYQACEYAECAIRPSAYIAVCIDGKCEMKEKER